MGANSRFDSIYSLYSFLLEWPNSFAPSLSREGFKVFFATSDLAAARILTDIGALSPLNSQFSIQSHLRIRFRFWIVDLAVMVVAIATITAGGASLDIFLFSGTVCTFPNKMCFDEVYGVKARQRRLCAAVQGAAMPHEGGSSTSTITVPPFTLTTIVRLASLDLLSPTAAPYTNVQSQFPLILIELTTVIESLELSPTLAPKKRRRRRRSVVTCSVSVLANCSFTITTLWITADALSYTIFVWR